MDIQFAFEQVQHCVNPHAVFKEPFVNFNNDCARDGMCLIRVRRASRESCGPRAPFRILRLLKIPRQPRHRVWLYQWGCRAFPGAICCVCSLFGKRRLPEGAGIPHSSRLWFNSASAKLWQWVGGHWPHRDQRQRFGHFRE